MKHQPTDLKASGEQFVSNVSDRSFNINKMIAQIDRSLIARDTNQHDNEAHKSKLLSIPIKVSLTVSRTNED